MDRRLEARLASVAHRVRQRVFWNAMVLAWLTALPAAAVVYGIAGDVVYALAAAAVCLVLFAAFAWRRACRQSDLDVVAKLVERTFPDLQSRLLTAVEQKRQWPDGYSFLQQMVIEQTLTHARIHGWENAAPNQPIQVARAANLLIALVSAAAFWALRPYVEEMRPAFQLASTTEVPAGAVFDAVVEPGNVELERGTDLLVLARFNGPIPDGVELVAGPQTLPMTKSLADPIFAGRVEDVTQDLTYYVRYGSQQSQEYQVTVFDYPELTRMDAHVVYPEYSQLGPETIEDVRRVTAVEGSKVTLTFHLNKAVAQAKLVAEDGEAVELTATPDALQWTWSLELTASARYKLALTDDRGRRNQDDVEISLVALPNRPPELQVQFPSRDLRVSPLEEIVLQATAWDDFGLGEFGLNYSVPGGEPVSIRLGEAASAKEKKQMDHLLQMESLAVKPDQLVSYYFWAEDVGPDGKKRRTLSDMFFAEVRHFEEIFRQGEQPPGGAQSAQQQQQMQGGAAQQLGELAEVQKQIVNATWKMLRQFDEPEKNLPVIRESQQSAFEQLSTVRENARDPNAQQSIDEVEKYMTDALHHLSAAQDTLERDNLEPALLAEQQALQALLSLRAREHNVVRGQQPQGGGGGGGGGAAQQQLQQLELDNRENRYETRRQANLQQQQQQQRREDNQVLNRLKELAQRQQDLNQRLKELQAALEEARTQEEQEKLQRELKRLRDEQQEILRDVDQLRDRMQQPENQSRMAEANRQLEQTRDNVREATKALEEGMVSQALSQGSRAERDFQQLREDFRKKTANQFEDSMRQMQEQARELAEGQKKVAEKLDELTESQQRTLRDKGEQEQVAEQLRQTEQELKGLLEQMKEVVTQAESAEPLLSNQLYDSYRKVYQKKVDQALAQAAELTRLGFVSEAKRPEQHASSAIEELRQDIDKAASSILGDEAEALRRARQEVENLREELDRELAQATGRDPNRRSEPGEAQDPSNDSSGEGGSEADRLLRSLRGQSGQRRPGDESEPANQGRSGLRGNPESSDPSSRQGGQAEDRDREQGQERRSGRTPGERRGEADPKQQSEDRDLSENQQAGERSQRGQGNQPGEQADGQEQNRPGEERGEQREEGQRGGQGQGENRRGRQDDDPNDDAQQGQGRQSGGRGQDQQGESQGSQEGGDQEGSSDQPGGRQQRLAQAREGSRRFFEGGMNSGPGGPIAGEGYRDWADRIRDVEEMLQDPELRSRAAQIRDRARAMRIDIKRHSKEPNWSLVEKMIAEPLAELSDQLALELARRDSEKMLVPIDRDPVPRQFQELVRRYYEDLGSGRPAQEP